MASRLQLQKELENLGIPNVYFQPPENVKLKYPACIYHLSQIRSSYAADMPHSVKVRYNLLYITKDPDDVMIEKLAWAFSTMSHGHSYVHDGLYHHSFDLYY